MTHARTHVRRAGFVGLCRKWISRSSRWGRAIVAHASACGVALLGVPLEARSATWTAGSAVDLEWSNAANWDTGEPGPADEARFVLPVPNPGGLTSPRTILLSAGETADSLRFEGDYRLSGGSLTLTSGLARVLFGASATIDSQLTGATGFIKRGDGALRLGNAANDYTGTTTIEGGVVSILATGALGTDTSAVVVTGNSLRGSGGGQLVVGSANNNLTGLTFTRDLILTGGGPTGDGNALLSVGNNVFEGAITIGTNPSGLNPAGGAPVTVSATNIASSFGNAVLNGPIVIEPSGQTIGFNGNGNLIVNGDISGAANLTKAGAGYLELNGNNTFTGIFQVNGGSVRVSSAAALGLSTSSSAVDIFAGTLEIRTDAPDFSDRKVRNDNGGQIVVDHALGSILQNQTVTFNSMQIDANETLILTGRNGYGMTFVGNMTGGNLTADNVFTINGDGLMTFQGNFWSNTNTSGNRQMIFNGHGSTLITGGIVATGGSHIFTKRGSGTMTLLGTNSSYTGQTNVEGGVLAINDFRAINNTNSAVVKIGNNGGTSSNAGLPGTLEIIGNNLLLANVTTNKVIALGGTTNGATILANQTGSSPGLLFNADLAILNDGYKSLSFGGSNTQDNTFAGAISDSAAGSTTVQKIGSGTWVLSGVNTYSGATQLTAGVLKIRDVYDLGSRNVLPDFGTVGFTFEGTTIGGTAAGGVLEYVGYDGVLSEEAGGTLALGAGAGTVRVTSGVAGSAVLGFNSYGLAHTVQAAAAATNATTLTLQSTAGIVPGMVMTGGSGTAVITVVRVVNDTQIIVSAGQTVTNGEDLTFLRPSGATVDFAPDVNASVLIGALPNAGFLNGYTYFRGADFAYAESANNATLRAPVYGTDAGFVVAAGALAADSHNLVDTTFIGNEATVASLKMAGTNTLTLGGLLTINAGAGTPGGILATGGAATIEGAGVTTGGAGDLVIRVDQASDFLSLSAPIDATTTGGLTKSGAGTLVLSGFNAQTGPININEGKVMLSSSARLSADSSAFYLRQGAVFDLNAGTTLTSATTASIGSFNGAGLITNDQPFTTGILGVGGGNGAGTFSGIIADGADGTGIVRVEKIGSGAQIWSGLNTYSGPTTFLSTGKVTIAYLADIGQASGIGRGDATDDGTNAASLVFRGASTSGSVAGIIYNGSTSVSTNRLFTIGGDANTGAYIASNGLNNAAVVFRNTAPFVYEFGSSGVKWMTLDGSSQGDNRINLQLYDNDSTTSKLNVVKNGTGLWILGNEANTYSGDTRLNRGMLRAVDGASLPATSHLRFNSSSSQFAILESTGTFTRDVGTAPGEVSWRSASATDNANGGFAAAESKLTVNLFGDGRTLVWRTDDFLGGNLYLSSVTALAETEFVNGLDINGAFRTIIVDANSTTAAAYATITGAISGTGSGGEAIRKGGGGVLQLLGNSTYTGDTWVQAGTLRVASIGNSTSVSSGLGDGTGAVLVGNGTSTTTFVYIGDGETSDRAIRIGGTSSSIILEASGSGPLVLSNVSNASTGTVTKTLFLRGDSNDANEITSVLSNNSAGATMNLSKDDNGTWILSGQNTYSGTTSASLGSLGLGVDSIASGGVVTAGPVGVGQFNVSNVNLFAAYGDRALDNTLLISATATLSFVGSYGITLNGPMSVSSTTSSTATTINNMLPTGKFLTINSPTFTHPNDTTKTIVFTGSGDTILNSSVTDGTLGGAYNFTYNGYGSLTLGGPGRASTYSGNTTLTGGRLKLGVAEAIPGGVGKGSVTFNPAAGLAAALDLNGFDQTLNSVTAVTPGLVTIDNSGADDAVLTLGANDGTADGTVNYFGAIDNTGAGALSIVKIGSGTAAFSQGPFAHRGATTVTGGTLTFAADVSGTTSLSVTGDGSELRFQGGFSASAGVTQLTVGAGSLLSLIDGAGSQLTNLTTLSLGATGSGTTTLNLNVGDLVAAGDGLQTDTLGLLSGGALGLLSGNTITFNLNDAGLNPGQTYTLLSAADGGFLSGGLTAGHYILNNAPGGFTTIDLNVTNNEVQLVTGTLVTGDLYWTGALGTAWNAGVGNWSSTEDGTGVAQSIPGAGTNAIFQSDVAAGGDLVTTLEQSFKVNSLRFEPSTSTPSSVTIGSGVDPLFRLQIAPQVATDGIVMATGGPQAVTISAPLRLGASQTWDIVDAVATLTVSGALSGSGTLTKAGLGKVVASAAAETTFGVTELIVNAGTFEAGDVTALGNAALGNAAAVTINADGLFYYNNAASGIFANAITLNGGTLSVGGATQTYSGNIAIAADSVISTRNLGVTVGTTRTINLTGVLSGPGRLTFSGNSALSGGNSVSGTVVITQPNPDWTGGVLIQEGTIDLRNEQGLGTGAVAIETGRILFKGATGTTWSVLAAGLTIDDLTGNAVAEFHTDGQGSAGNYTTDIVGDIVMGGSGASPIMRLYQTDVFSNFVVSGDILLNADGLIHNAGGTTDYTGRDNVITGVISDGGAGFGLSINGDTTWGDNDYQVLRLDAANTFSGYFRVAGGVAAFSTVSNVGGGPSNLGQGTDIILTSGGFLRFVGDGAENSQATDRPLTFLGSSTLEANGANGATITYNGTIDATAPASITLLGTGSGIINGNITQTGTSNDILVNSGTWTLAGAANTLADDIIVTGATAVLNLNTSGVLNYVTSGSNGLYARGGATINILADHISGVDNAGGLDFVIMDNGVGTINLAAGLTLTVPRIDFGSTLDGAEGNVLGGGTIVANYLAADYGSSFRLFRGTVDANLAGTLTSVLKQGLGEVTLLGDNSGLGGAVATRIDSGTLILDHRVNNATKLNAAAALDLRGGTVRLIGNEFEETWLFVASTTLASGGSNRLELVSSGDFVVVGDLGAITRNDRSNDGTLRVVTQPSTGFFTSTANAAHGLLGSTAYMTIDDGTGTYFATNIDGLIMPFTYDSGAANDVSTWTFGQHVTDEGAGYFGTLDNVTIGSLRFNAAAQSSVVFGNPAGVLGLQSGGILATAATGGPISIVGGIIASSTNEVVITQDSQFEMTISSEFRSALNVIKTGPGTLILTGNNNANFGTFDIQDGTVVASGGNALTDTGVINFADDHTSRLLLTTHETVGRLSGGSGSNGLNHLAELDSSFYTLTINQTGASTYSGRFVGTGTIVKSGPLDLTLANYSPDFTGDLVINSGGLSMASVGGIAAQSITVNTGTLQLSSTSSTRITTKILDTTAITLNSAAAGAAGDVIPRGLYATTNQNANVLEVIGDLVFGSGASYLTGHATGGTSSIAGFTAANFVRTNNATVSARAIGLGLASGARSLFRINVDADENAWMAANLIGGGGTAGGTAKNVSIVPWAIGENLTAATTVTNMGNTFLTYIVNRGFVPLDVADEYATYAAALADSNTRESLSADLTGLAGKTINSLVLHKNATAEGAINVSGAGGSLTNASGGFLFTLNTAAAASSAHSFVLDGFADIAVAATNEYVFHVVNPSAAADTAILTAQIDSALSSAADITKSGRGTLVLTAANTAGGGARKTVLNEGILEIADLDNIGGSTGGLVFAGGTLRLAADFSGDALTTRTIEMLAGGGALDTNGLDFAINATFGSGVGGFTKAGAGTLTLNAATGYAGTTTVAGGVLAVTGGNFFTGGDLFIASGASFDVGATNQSFGRVTLAGASAVLTGTGTIAASAGFLIESTATIDAVLAGAGGLMKTTSRAVTLNGLNTYTGPTELTGGTTTFTSLAMIGGGASSFGAPTNAADGVIHMGNASTASVTLTYVGAGSVTDRILGFQGTTGTMTLNANGTGALVMGGARVEYAGTKTFTLGGSSAADIENSIGTIYDGLSTLNLNKSGANTWVLTAANTYTGATTAGGGTLRVAHNSALGSTTGINLVNTSAILELADGITIDKALSVSNTGNNKTLQLQDGATSGTYSGDITILESSANNFDVSAFAGGTFTISGAIGGTTATGVTKENAGTVVLSGANTYTGATLINAGILRVDSVDALGTTGAIGFGGGTLQYSSGNQVDYSARFSTAAGQAYRIDTNAQSVVYATALTGAGNTLTKLGAGSLSLNADVGYTGDTTVSGGTLNGTASLATTTVVVQAGGTFSPGYSPNGIDNNGVGQTTVAGAVWEDGASFVFDFGAVDFGNTAAADITDWDFISIASGGLSLAGSSYTLDVYSWDLDAGIYGTNDFTADAESTIDPVESSPGGIDAAYRWLWVENAGVADGHLSQFNVNASPGVFEPGLPGSYGPNVGGTFWVSSLGGNLYVNYSAVPEPSSLMLLGIAGAGWLGYRRRKRRAAPNEIDTANA